jgi:hypothetical protein
MQAALAIADGGTALSATTSSSQGSCHATVFEPASQPDRNVGAAGR